MKLFLTGLVAFCLFFYPVQCIMAIGLIIFFLMAVMLVLRTIDPDYLDK